ncbi:transposase [Alkalibaculum sporogenes]|nr:transposase [Alkalibaculum sporogenes]
MPREVSESNYYHVMVVGNDNKNIFIEDMDKKKILLIVKKYSEDNILSLLAYCVLDTHAHFLIEIHKYDISTIMKKINISYANYYNFKYNSKGHVFYDRFKSECIRDTQYLLPIIRYIHNNPSGNQLLYKWSSYNEYIEDSMEKFLSYNLSAFSEFGNEETESIHNFINYTKIENDDIFLDIEEGIENKINNMIRRYLCKNNIELKDLGYKKNKVHRINLVLMIKNTGKLSIRKIGSLLKLNRGIIYNILREYNNEGEE